ncbi:MFS transporter, partial [archaeon]
MRAPAMEDEDALGRGVEYTAFRQRYVCAHAARGRRTRCRVGQIAGSQNHAQHPPRQRRGCYRTVWPRPSPADCRFGVLASFGLSSSMNAYLWIFFAPIADIAQARFDVSALAISALTLVFMGVYLPGSLMGVYVMERYGLRACLLSGAALNAACAWVLYGGMFIAHPHTSYAVVMVGQLLGALSQPLFGNLPTRIAGDWFPASERDLATVGAVLTGVLGNFAGAVIPPFMVQCVADMPRMLLWQGIACSAIFVVSLVFVADRPPSPPSAAAAHKWQVLEAGGAAGGRPQRRATLQ